MHALETYIFTCVLHNSNAILPSALYLIPSHHTLFSLGDVREEEEANGDLGPGL